MSISRVSGELGIHKTHTQARIDQLAIPRATYEFVPAGKGNPILLYHPQSEVAENAFSKSGFVPVQGWAGVSGEKSVTGFIHKSDLTRFEQHYETGPATFTFAWKSQQGLKRIASGKLPLSKDRKIILAGRIETRSAAKRALSNARSGGLAQLGRSREASVPPIFRAKKTYIAKLHPADSPAVKTPKSFNPVYYEFLPTREKSHGELSGASWVNKYPTSTHFEGLKGSFKQGMYRFHDSLVKAGAKVKVESTHRPRERAYLMHWSYRIAREGFDPRNVPPLSGVNIQWWHGDVQRSRAAASAMVKAYDIVARPSLHSNHSHGNAVDMTIKWEGTLNLRNGKGEMVQIKGPSTDPRALRQLREVAKTFGVYQSELLAKRDPVHWSSTGA